MLSSGNYTQAQIAEALNVAHGTVRGWSSKKKTAGDALKKQAKRGRPKGDGKALTKTEERKIIAIIRDKNPKQLHLEFYLWSVGAVIALIEKKLEKSLSDSGMRKYLKAWGFTIQRPATRYSRRDDVVVQRWLALDYPRIAAAAKAEGAEIHWLDETGVNNQTVYQRGFAPKGKTPIATKPAQREKISLISTVTNRGQMRFRLFEGALNAAGLVAFLEALVRGSSRKLYVIMDNLPVHKGKLVTAWIAANADKIKVFYLPPYAPDVNPDEYLNNDLKQNIHTKSGLSRSKRALKASTLAYLRHIQKSPAKVQSYFQAAETQYAA
jgi:transposase